MTLRDVNVIRELVTPEAFQNATGKPLAEFSRMCHGASLALVHSGMLGPDARVARGWCKGVGVHSWAVIGDPYSPDVVIVDPTLWSYDPDVEGIWVGTAKDGRHRPQGAGSIWEHGRPPEPVDEPIALTPKVPLSRFAQQFLAEMVGPLDYVGWMSLANSPVGGWPAAEIIAAMDDTQAVRAAIPMDILGMLTDRNPSGLYR